MKALNAEGVPAGIWQHFMLPAMTVFQAKNAYGHGCPWSCQYSHAQDVNYDPADFPAAQRHVDTHFGLSTPLRDPNGKEVAEAVADGITRRCSKTSASSMWTVSLTGNETFDDVLHVGPTGEVGKSRYSRHAPADEGTGDGRGGFRDHPWRGPDSLPAGHEKSRLPGHINLEYEGDEYPAAEATRKAVRSLRDSFGELG